MANWCNARLIAIGPREAVSAFAQKARTRPTTVFRSDMLVGGAQRLRSEPLERVDANRYRKVYLFQVRNDNGFEYFKRLSKRHRKLTFVLVYANAPAVGGWNDHPTTEIASQNHANANVDLYGSYWFNVGLAREYCVSHRQSNAVMRRHRVTLEDEDEWRFWEASWELMDIAEVKWESFGGRPPNALQSTSRERDRTQRSERRARARATRG